ncbi:MAG TPA: endo-1,4-beta-xylanase [Bacteroidales bacterium]|nr:endo-1,4-beta-xylanase [Bacteroidales bacterium]
MKKIFMPAVAAIAIMLSACGNNDITLKKAFEDHFLIGTAMNGMQISGTDPQALPFIASQFNSVTAENEMKWERIHPEPGVYNFGLADSIVDFAEQNGMKVIGHTLVWHSQTPRGVFQDSLGNQLTRDALLERMREHIHTVVGHYKGRVLGWDVVNEALNEDGTLRNTKWLEIIGEDYIEKAFIFANEADPDAELYYNDYNIEEPAKLAGVIPIIENLQAKGIRIDGVGIQGHWHLDSPDLAIIDESIGLYGALGIKVMITEMEINVLPTPTRFFGAEISNMGAYLDSLNPYVEGLPDSVQMLLTNRYEEVFRILLKHDDLITRVTFWGVHDGYSWKNGWPIPGRTNYPLLFNRDYTPKPAYDAVIREVKKLK